MRAHTTLRTAFRFGMMATVATGISFAATQAHAGDVGAPGANTSIGTANLKFESTKGIDTNLDTGFVPKNSIIQARAVLKIDPVKDGGPLYTVAMPKGAVVEASWAGDKKIVLKATNGAQTDGTVKVRHTLTPTLTMRLAIPHVLTADFDFDATALLNKLEGSQFAYDSKATQTFAPWGFTPVDTRLNAPDLANATLFSKEFSDFPEVINGVVEGTFGVRATTKPTFSYKTTKVMLSGTNAPLTSGASEVSMDAVDGDFMEVMAQVEGEMTVAGKVSVQPFISVTQVNGYNFKTTLAFDGVDLDISSPLTTPDKVAFQSSIVHIPLPNVHAPSEGVDIGAVKPGGSATKTVSIENSGEKAAQLTFKSSDPQFEVPGGIITIEPKGKYEAQIKFASSNAGPVAADITIMSNDPDSPEQTFKMGANGADVGGKGGSGDPADLPGAGGADSGCGCKTAGTTTSTGGWAGIGLFAIGALVIARRRRNSAA